MGKCARAVRADVPERLRDWTGIIAAHVHGQFDHIGPRLAAIGRARRADAAIRLSGAKILNFIGFPPQGRCENTPGTLT